MNKGYNEAVASHYAAYRPPLHQLILEQAIGDKGRLARGLDVGCGTGRSSIALTNYCESVIAVDPSPSMIDAATRHDAITYMNGTGEQLPLLDATIDVVTFAGSLSYCTLPATGNELLRVCRPEALIVPYDFHVLMDDLLDRFGISKQTLESDYDHAKNFSGIDGLEEIEVHRDQIEFDVAPIELAHLLLADHERHSAFAIKYKSNDPLDPLVSDLCENRQHTSLIAEVFFSLYRTLL